jgi:hypothetical protein
MEHDLFPKTGIHFSGSCSSLSAILLIVIVLGFSCRRHSTIGQEH